MIAAPGTCPAAASKKCGDSDGWVGDFFFDIPKIKYEESNANLDEVVALAKELQTQSMEVYQLAKGNRKKPQWLRPNARLQPNGNDCGYYVMKNMLDIVSANITKSWMEVFNDPLALTEQELYDLRNTWATCFLDLHKA
ncbi:hypothetical protein OROGR_031047 [Orobanche gracilis]